MRIVLFLLICPFLSVPSFVKAETHDPAPSVRWPVWEKKFQNYAAFRMGIQELMCQMPGKLLIDSFRLSKDAPDYRFVEPKVPQLLKGASAVLRDLKTLVSEKAIPEGLFLQLDNPWEESQASIELNGDGYVPINLLKPPSLSEMRSLFKTAKGASRNIQKPEEVKRHEKACEVIAALGAHGGMSFSGKDTAAHIRMLEQLKKITALGYRLKAPTTFVEITAADVKRPKPYYFGGKSSQLMIPANADQESLLSFMEKAKS